MYIIFSWQQTVLKRLSLLFIDYFIFYLSALCGFVLFLFLFFETLFLNPITAAPHNNPVILRGSIQFHLIQSEERDAALLWLCSLCEQRHQVSQLSSRGKHQMSFWTGLKLHQNIKVTPNTSDNITKLVLGSINSCCFATYRPSAVYRNILQPLYVSKSTTNVKVLNLK